MDFIGHQHREFPFDLRYRALTGYGRKELEKAVEDECPYLPSGSQSVLDRVAQEVVLDNIRTSCGSTAPSWSGTGHHVLRGD
jgi:hypothetical protein